jgi:hypothetical protein
LAQRQILVEAQQALRGSGHNEDIELVERICRGFGEFLYPLGHRQQGRKPIVMEDEYDVQDFLHGLLRIFFDDVHPEDFSPERAGARSRIDFVLKQERVVVEAKMTRAGLAAATNGVGDLVNTPGLTKPSVADVTDRAQSTPRSFDRALQQVDHRA